MIMMDITQISTKVTERKVPMTRGSTCSINFSGFPLKTYMKAFDVLTLNKCP